MNIVVLQGTLSKEPMERTLSSGVNVMDWEITTETEAGRRHVPVQWTDASKRVCDFVEGDRVVVLGEVRLRYFRADGRTVARTEVVGGEVAKPTQTVRVQRLFERTRGALLS